MPSLVERANKQREYFRQRERFIPSSLNGEMLRSKQLVYFHTPWDFRFAGDDAVKMQTAIDHCCDTIKAEWLAGKFHGEYKSSDRHAMNWLPALKASQAEDGTPVFIIPMPLYNLILWVLDFEGMKMMGEPLEENPGAYD